MSRALFGTDGLRGLAGQYPLDQAGAVRIGQAIGMHFAQSGERVVMAHDPRESSTGLVEALVQGLTAVGVNVTLVGVMPTPGLAYLTREGSEFVAGVMVTASHNPVEYNGVKVFDRHGDKLTDETESALNQLIETELAPRGSGTLQRDAALITDYEDFLVHSAEGVDFSQLRLAVDSANGAASGLAGRVFKRLGATITPLFETPDGQNINADCGATHPEALSHEVVSHKLDLGIALDGDADRLIMIDGQGRTVNGDYLLYLLALSRQLKGVVATVMSNFGLEQTLRQQHIDLERVDVGDRYVLEGLQRTGFRLGGEQSGHIIFPELLATGDGLLAAVQTVRALSDSGKSLAAWRDELQLLPQALVNIKLTDKTLLDRAAVQIFIKAQTDQLADQGRILIRPSGTEPLARVMVEAPEAQAMAERIAEELEVLLNKEAGLHHD
jgi:phosphoglucosamine mutase